MQNESSSTAGDDCTTNAKFEDYLPNDAVFSSVFPPFTPFLDSLSLMQHQDQINRTALCVTRLRETARELESLRLENATLRSVNRELHNHLNFLVQASFQKLCLTSSDYNKNNSALGPEAVNSFLNSCGNGGREEMFEDESPTSVMGPERIALPKSISVRSSGYLKMSQAAAAAAAPGTGGGGASKTRVVTRTGIKSPPNAAKVYVRQGKKEEEPLELEVYNQGMFKTELCNKWQETGACPYGDHCQFAHGIEELRPVIRHPRYKTEVCRMVLAGDICPYGHRCHFRHALTEEERFTGHLRPRALKLER